MCLTQQLEPTQRPTQRPEQAEVRSAANPSSHSRTTFLGTAVRRGAARRSLRGQWITRGSWTIPPTRRTPSTQDTQSPAALPLRGEEDSLGVDDFDSLGLSKGDFEEASQAAIEKVNALERMEAPVGGGCSSSSSSPVTAIVLVDDSPPQGQDTAAVEGSELGTGP